MKKLKMVNNYTIKTTYYDRKMDEKLLTQINERFPWIISYVKSHNCLDFQTGNDPKTNRSWFSIYQGKRTSANCLIINSSLLFSKLI